MSRSQVALLDLHPEALAELEAAVVWHEAERPGYGRLLYVAFRKRLLQATRFPKSGASVAGLDDRYDVRRFLVRDFRYSVITACVNDGRVVVAVAHTSRDPGYGRARLK